MRELGELGMSVGTSLAFESDEAKHAIPETDTFLINLRTLIRNTHGAYPKDDPLINDIDSLKAALIEDIKLIATTISEIAPRSTINVEIYYPSYNSLGRKFPHATLWKPKTDKQKELHQLYDDIAEEFIKEYPTLVTKTDCGMPEFKGRGLVITHHVVDLVLTEGWSRLRLLESQTGAVKPYLMWYTKLTGSNNESIPLNRMTIQVFGDKSTNFLGQSLAIKKLVKDLASKANWTSATTPQRCRSSINTYMSGVDRDGLMLFW
ncbi:hypothetical protein [Vibrio phage phiKT1028]|nr:hypothetical protein [Vibrio phage phiKT1028]